MYLSFSTREKNRGTGRPHMAVMLVLSKAVSREGASSGVSCERLFKGN